MPIVLLMLALGQQIIIILMSNSKSKLEQLQTRIETPYKTFTNGFNKMNSGTIIRQSMENTVSQNLSETQNHLYSRQIVRNLIINSNKNSIRHQINQIHPKSPLYAQPHRYNPQEFMFDNIPPTNPHYSSSCSNKIKTINEGLKKNKMPSQPSKRYKQQNRTTSATLESRNQRVSISGLITYKFHSINAKRSLGFNQINHEETLKKEVKNSKQLGSCQTNRFKKILLKNTYKKYQQKLRQEQGILSNFDSKTNQYLKERLKENQQELLVYGEKAKKLHFIKDYMYSEKADYSQGRHLMTQIEKYSPKDEVFQHKKCKTQIDQDRELETRRNPINKRRVKIRFLTFVD